MSARIPSSIIGPLDIGQANHGNQETGNWGLKEFNISQLWQSVTGKGVKVAVLDSGVQPNHPDLQDGVDIMVDESFNNSSKWADLRGHGTHCAGIIGARRNGLGVLGVAPDCRILVIKVINDEYGSHPDYLASGITWAADQGANIISMSIGFTQSSQNLDSALEYAAGKHILLVAAGGNNEPGVVLKQVLYPALSPDCIAVGCVDQNNSSAGISVLSPRLDIVAPGIDIYSTDIAKNNFYSNRSGTSMAAAFISGVLALALEKVIGQRPSVDPVAIRTAMKQSAKRLDSSNSSEEFSCGLIDPASFLSTI